MSALISCRGEIPSCDPFPIFFFFLQSSTIIFYVYRFLYLAKTRKLSLFLPGGLILAEFFTTELSHFLGTKKSKKYFFIKKHFFQNYFWKECFFPILFFTAELSHFLGQKNQKNI
jgi:hypothetical protein